MPRFEPVDRAVARAAAQALIDAPSAAAFTGAGISTASGIPDFRSPGSGIWATVDPATVASTSMLRSDPATFWRFYRERFTGLEGKQPNRAHHALAELERDGHIRGVITQNVDGLHRLAGSQTVHELHGNLRALRCVSCERRYQETDLARLTDQHGVPRCEACEPTGGPATVRPGIVLFGEVLPEHATRGAARLLADASCLLTIGSSLQVHPAAAMPGQILRKGGTVILINGSQTPYDTPGAAGGQLTRRPSGPWDPPAPPEPGRLIRMRCDIVEAMDAIMDALGKIAGASRP